MSDLRDTFVALNEDRKDRHAAMKAKNTKLLLDNGLNCIVKNDGEVILIRTLGRAKIDFYPSTGRWKWVDTGRIQKGGAEKFLRMWYGL